MFSQPWSLCPRVPDLMGVILAWWSVLDMVDLIPFSIGSIGFSGVVVALRSVAVKRELISTGEYASSSVLTAVEL